MSSLVDTRRRAITYLRVSITDRCNLRCVYCMPAEGAVWKPRAEILSYEEIVRLVRVAQGLGVRKVRLTGGEPLVRRDCWRLVAALADLGLDEICLTSNGLRFVPQAAELKAAGLTRVNLSLDTLRPERFAQITRGGRIEQVWDAVEAALALDLKPRLNVVAIRGFNDDEFEDFARLTIDRPLTVRFIEVMPFSGATDPALLTDLPEKPVDCDAKLVDPLPIEEVRARLGVGPRGSHPSGELPVLNTLGPAEYIHLPGAQGEVGFIAAMHEHICDRCNRVRVTADGWLKPCLLGDERVYVRDALRAGDDEAVRAAFAQLMLIKPAHGRRDTDRPEAMSMIGG